jgi:hypothetical protein
MVGRSGLTENCKHFFGNRTRDLTVRGGLPNCATAYSLRGFVQILLCAFNRSCRVGRLFGAERFLRPEGHFR